MGVLAYHHAPCTGRPTICRRTSSGTGMNTRATALPASEMDGRGLAAACGAFFIWGVLPIYLKWLHAVPVLQVTAHRLTWGCLVAFAWLGVRGELGHVRTALADPRVRIR